MFDSSSQSSKLTTKIGAWVTILALVSGCVHKEAQNEEPMPTWAASTPNDEQALELDEASDSLSGSTSSDLTSELPSPDIDSSPLESETTALPSEPMAPYSEPPVSKPSQSKKKKSKKIAKKAKNKKKLAAQNSKKKSKKNSKKKIAKKKSEAKQETAAAIAQINEPPSGPPSGSPIEAPEFPEAVPATEPILDSALTDSAPVEAPLVTQLPQIESSGSDKMKAILYWALAMSVLLGVVILRLKRRRVSRY